MDSMLKQRLVGAIIIVSLAVIFIPLILEGPEDELASRNQEMPPPPRIDYQAEVELPIPTETPEPVAAPDSQPGRESPVVAAAPQAAAEPEPVPPPAEPVAETTAAETPAPPPAAPAPAASSPPAAAGTWAVQVGSFSQQLNAQGLRDRLRKAGYTVFLRDVKTGNTHTWRVLLGPLNDRGKAEQLRDRLSREQHLKGIVIQHPG